MPIASSVAHGSRVNAGDPKSAAAVEGGVDVCGQALRRDRRKAALVISDGSAAWIGR